ncbi:rhomboid family intramembrane serine protease [Corynebacterium sp. sy039]|nr:rhomboid family intramembrane serine protease [Corynebacterium sp. sy039]
MEIGVDKIPKDENFMSALRSYYKQAPATTCFAALMVAIWLITVFQSSSIIHSLVGSSLGNALMMYGPYATQFPAGLVRIFGNAFVHQGASHLAMNLFILIFLGREVEKFFGSAIYTLIFITGISGASAAITWMSYAVPVIGASGTIFSLMTLYTAIAFYQRINMQSALVLLGINIVSTFIIPGISIWGHLGGVVTGIALMPLVTARRKKARGVQLVWIVVLLLVTLVLIFQREQFFA